MRCVLTKFLSHAVAKNKTKMPKGFKFGTFIGRFQVRSWQLTFWVFLCISQHKHYPRPNNMFRFPSLLFVAHEPFLYFATLFSFYLFLLDRCLLYIVIFSVFWKPFLLLLLFPLGRLKGMLSSFLYFQSLFFFVYFLSAWQMFTVNSHLFCILKMFLFIYLFPLGRLNGMLSSFLYF